MRPDTNVIITREQVSKGALSCRGCGWSLLARYVSNVMGPETVYVVPACCFSIIAGPNPMNLMNGTVVHTLFAAAAATATGVRHALDRQGRQDTNVVVLAGDGGTFDIGLQAVSGAASREENILFICNNNGAYMNTGVQSSAGTPSGVRTTTDPAGKTTPAKNVMEIIEAHHIPYFATASPAYLRDLQKKLEKARDIAGFRFLMIDGPCPPGHKHDPSISIELARIAVETRFFPLFESANGGIEINYFPQKNLPVNEYLKRQGRFAHLYRDGSGGRESTSASDSGSSASGEQDQETSGRNREILNAIQMQVDKQWEKLLGKQVSKV